MKIFLIAALLICSLIASAQDSPMFRGDLQHSGVYSSVGVPKFSRVKWKFHTNGYVLSSPAIANGTAYVGSTDHNLYAIDLKSGAQKWKFATRSRVTSSPAVAGGTVYFGSFDGNFYAVDAATGQQKWKFATAGERRFTGKRLHGSEPSGESMPDPFDFFLSSPAIWNGAVYFGSGDGNIYSLDVATGQLKWKFQTGDVVHASPAIANGTLFIGSWDSYFYALDAATGKEKWKFKTGEDTKIYNQVGIQSSAVVADDMVYFGCRDSNVYALDVKTGAQRWVFNNKMSWVITTPIVHDGRLYFATSDSGMFHALDAKSGASLFSNKFIWPMFSSPAIAGSTLYIGSHQGKVIAVDLKTQKQSWEFQSEDSRKNGPALTKADGTPKYEAAFRDNFYDEMMIGLDKMLSVGAFLSSPVVVNDVVYIGSTDGNLYALI
jgi:eukaryotic-like serine/threonine-protein kinase